MRFLPISLLPSDHHIQAASPAINAGNGALNPSINEIDLDYDRQNRPNGGQVDIGADERYTTTEPSPAAITVTSPDGGEILVRGTVHTITWNYTGNPGAAVRIYLLRNGSLFRIITTSTPIGAAGSGSFDWNISTTIPTTGNYRVRVQSTSNTALSDTSDGDFIIE